MPSVCHLLTATDSAVLASQRPCKKREVPHHKVKKEPFVICREEDFTSSHTLVTKAVLKYSGTLYLSNPKYKAFVCIFFFLITWNGSYIMVRASKNLQQSLQYIIRSVTLSVE